MTSHYDECDKNLTASSQPAWDVDYFLDECIQTECYSPVRPVLMIKSTVEVAQKRCRPALHVLKNNPTVQ